MGTVMIILNYGFQSYRRKFIENVLPTSKKNCFIYLQRINWVGYLAVFLKEHKVEMYTPVERMFIAYYHLNIIQEEKE
jgi:hypothetical protein